MRGKSIIVAFLLAIGTVALSYGSARADLVVNGSFATGDFTGWNVNGDDIQIDSSFANAPTDTYDAAFSAAVGDIGDTLSQSVPTSPGQSYQLTFSILDQSGFSGNLSDTFTVTFGGFTAILVGQDAVPFFDGTDLYTSQSFTIAASNITDTTTILSFEGQNANVSDWNLDDVSVTALNGVNAVPEPGSLLLLGTALAGYLALSRRALLQN